VNRPGNLTPPDAGIARLIEGAMLIPEVLIAEEMANRPQ